MHVCTVQEEDEDAVEDDGCSKMAKFVKDRINDLPNNIGIPSRVFKELPEGSRYCPHCTCQICGNLVVDEDSPQFPGALKCLQCEHKYHAACIVEREGGLQSGEASDSWCCTDSCQEVYSGLQSCIGIMNLISDSFGWTLLRSEFARLNYQGFQTVVLEKDDVLMSVASIRLRQEGVIFGAGLAKLKFDPYENVTDPISTLSWKRLTLKIETSVFIICFNPLNLTCIDLL